MQSSKKPSCHNTTMEQFCECLFDGVELENFEEIYKQYCELIGDSVHNEMFTLIKEINLLKAKIDLVTNIIDFLEISEDEEIKALLKPFGAYNDPAGKIARWLNDKKILDEKYEKTRSTTKTATRENYEEIVDAIAQHRGYHIAMNQITVAQFCRGYKQLETLANAKH